MKRGELFINYLITLGPVIFALILLTSTSLVRSMPKLTFISMITLFIIGFLFFLKAKLSLIHLGTIISFGSKKMTKPNKYMYLIGYGCMLFGLFILLGFLVTLKTSEVIN